MKRLNTELNKPTNHNSLKSPKLLSQQISKGYYKTLGTSVIITIYLSIVQSYNPYSQRERGQLAVYYTSPQSPII